MRQRAASAAAWSGILLAAALAWPARSAELRPGSDWPAFLGPTGDSKSPETGIRTDWSDGLPLTWWRRAGEGYGAPSTADGVLYLFERLEDQARLVALDAATGEELWSSAYPTAYEDYYGYSNGPRTSPVIDGDRVYVFGVEGRLRCLAVEDGRLLWEVDTAERFGVVQNFFGVGSTPVVEGDLLIAQIGGSPPGSPRIHSGEVRGDGSGLVAFDKRTGTVRWRATDELASYAGLRLAAIGGRRWGFAFLRGGLVGFEPATGKVDFHFPWRARILESVNASTPLVVGDTVLIAESYGPGAALLRVRPDGYEVVWRDPPRSRQRAIATHWNTPIEIDGTVYASSGRNRGDAELRAVDWATGEVRWREPGHGRSTLLAVDGHLISLSEAGVLRLIRPTPLRYQERGAIDLAAVEVTDSSSGERRPLLRAPAWSAPILSRGLLYLRGRDSLVALELVADRTR